MARLKNLFKQTEFQILLFCVYFVLICLPYLMFQTSTQSVNMYAMDMFKYFFVVWGIVIAILLLVSLSLGNESQASSADDEGDN